MRRFISILPIIVVLSLVTPWTGCGGPTMSPVEQPARATTPAKPAAAAQTTDIAAPEWFVNVPKEPGYLYAAGTAQSKDMQMALDVARHCARVELAKQVEVTIERSVEKPEGLQKSAGSTAVSSKVTSNGSTFVSREVTAEGVTIVSKETTSIIVLRGARVSKQEVRREGIFYRAYVLMRMPFEEANAIVRQKTQDATGETGKRATGLESSRQDVEKYEPGWLKELKAEMERYEQWKKKKEQRAKG